MYKKKQKKKQKKNKKTDKSLHKSVVERWNIDKIGTMTEASPLCITFLLFSFNLCYQK